MARKKSTPPKQSRDESTQKRALRVKARILRGQGRTAAARAERTDLRTVRKHLGAEFPTRYRKKQTQQTKPDRRPRDMLIPTARGISPIVVHGSKKATLLGRYMSAVGNYLRTGETDALAEFEGQSISGHRLITDPDTLSSLAQAGALQLDEIYALPESSS
jgi:hypothetical protein